MRQKLAGLAIIVSVLGGGHTATADWVFANSGPPLETPDYTYWEIVGCLSKKAAFKMPPTAFKAANADCKAKAQGLSLEDFFELQIGCVDAAFDADQLKPACASAIDKELRPYFQVNGPSFSTLALSADELAALQFGCTAIPKDKARCQTSLRKLKYLLQNPLPSLKPIDPPLTREEYLYALKVDSGLITAPNGDAARLMDPMGRLVRTKDGNPIDFPYDQPKQPK